MRRKDRMQFSRHELFIVMLRVWHIAAGVTMRWARQSWVSCCEPLRDNETELLRSPFNARYSSAARLRIWVCLFRFYCCRGAYHGDYACSHFSASQFFCQAMNMLDGHMLYLQHFFLVSIQWVFLFKISYWYRTFAYALQNNSIVYPSASQLLVWFA